MSKTPVVAPVEGRAVPLRKSLTPFSPRAWSATARNRPSAHGDRRVAPVSGKILKLLPHAYIVMTPDNVGILVHLGLDTVHLRRRQPMSRGRQRHRGASRHHL